MKTQVGGSMFVQTDRRGQDISTSFFHPWFNLYIDAILDETIQPAVFKNNVHDIETAIQLIFDAKSEKEKKLESVNDYSVVSATKAFQ